MVAKEQVTSAGGGVPRASDHDKFF